MLRALDTVEDDMTIPNDVKLPLLRALHTKLYEPGWTFKGSKEKDRIVLEEFDAIQTEFSLLDPKYVHNACRFIGAGDLTASAQVPICHCRHLQEDGCWYG